MTCVFIACLPVIDTNDSLLMAIITVLITVFLDICSSVKNMVQFHANFKKKKLENSYISLIKN